MQSEVRPDQKQSIEDDVMKVVYAPARDACRDAYSRLLVDELIAPDLC